MKVNGTQVVGCASGHAAACGTETPRDVGGASDHAATVDLRTANCAMVLRRRGRKRNGSHATEGAAKWLTELWGFL